MEASSSDEPPAKVHADGNSRDFISQLPDPIIHHIMSFMTTRDVVQKTNILSKRWKNLWTSMPNLFFTHEQFRIFEGHGLKVERFVKAVLLLRDTSDVHTFHLDWNMDFDGNIMHHLKTWIWYAVNRNVKVLEFCVGIDPYEDVELPRCFFTCQTLEKLILKLYTERGAEITLPEFIRLGRLRELHLGCINLDQGQLKTIISGCPVLECLNIFEGWLEDPDISCHTLKSLTIKSCQIDGTMIRISTHSLQCLMFVYNTVGKQKVLLENLSSLINANVQTDNYETKALKFISSRVKKSVPDAEIPGTSMFHRLKKLRLGGWMVCDNFPAMAHFLQRSPSLQTLQVTKENMGNQYVKNQNAKECRVFGSRDVEAEIQCGDGNEKVIELLSEMFASKRDRSGDGAIGGTV